MRSQPAVAADCRGLDGRETEAGRGFQRELARSPKGHKP